jgi:hypothetical protein
VHTSIKGFQRTSTGRPSDESIVKVLSQPSVSIMFQVVSQNASCSRPLVNQPGGILLLAYT